jgi:hypothetical protein
MKVDDGGGVEEGASVNNNEILPGHVSVCLRRADVVSNGSDYEAPVATSATHCCLLCTMMAVYCIGRSTFACLFLSVGLSCTHAQ